MEVEAQAKLNLTFEVLGKRGDGYHEVKTVMQTIGLSDRISLEHWPTLRVDCDSRELSGEANLVYKAAHALARSRGIQARARIRIQKRIPVAMGLGGGSSDAAAALRVLNDLWETGATQEELGEIAATIGSDVSFFLTGGTALAEGRGEIVSPLPPPAALQSHPRVSRPRRRGQDQADVFPHHPGALQRRRDNQASGVAVDRRRICRSIYQGLRVQRIPGYSRMGVPGTGRNAP